ncbi:MAG TPA: TolC family protein [Chitinophagaceae bacterium]|nr:TolC family protein [Chitinophagaceae bacterium]
MKKLSGIICIFFTWFLPFAGFAQIQTDTLQTATLDQCVQYALKHQPLIQQSVIDQQIVESSIKSKLADWYPQINLAASLQHNFQLPASIFNGSVNYIGTKNTSSVGLQATQNIFNRDVLLASRTANDVRTQVRQLTEADKIAVTVAVSQAFYGVLLTQKQIELTGTDINRLQLSIKDAYAQYQAGVVDKIDYKRATISLNKSVAQLKGQQDSLKAKYALLKQAMGYPDSIALDVQYDSIQMQKEIYVDTTQYINYDNRIEYRLLQTQRRLLQANIKYNKMAYYPTLSAFGGYNFNYLNNSFSKLYAQNFPTSNIGLQLSFPIFQGFKRKENIKGAELAFQKSDYALIGLRDTIITQYQQALAAYKSNLYDYTIFKDNLQLAQDVYNTLQLQYKAGVKTYLDVITAEDDLRTAEISYTNALYQVLISKINVQKALGQVQY